MPDESPSGPIAVVKGVVGGHWAYNWVRGLSDLCNFAFGSRRMDGLCLFKCSVHYGEDWCETYIAS